MPAKKDNTSCSVPQCRSNRTTISEFHLFPKNPAMRRKWESSVKLGKRASNYMRVCGLHFTPRDYFPRNAATRLHYLFPHAVPSQNLPQRAHDKKLSSFQISAREARAQRAIARQQKKGTFQKKGEEEEVLPEAMECPGEEGPSSNVVKRNIRQSTKACPADNRTRKYSQDPSLAENSLDEAAQEGFTSNTRLTKPNHRDVVELPEIISNDEELFTSSRKIPLEFLDGLVEFYDGRDGTTRILSIKHLPKKTNKRIKK